jgi:predicted Zn finger-like uncharacterized protein
MVMVIECESCQSRYRLDKALFKESKAIRVRCRKCGGFIVVANPESSVAVAEAPPPPPQPPAAPPSLSGTGPEPPVVPVGAPKAEPPPLPEETSRAMDELLRQIDDAPWRPPAPGGPPDLFGPSPGDASGGKAAPRDRAEPYPLPPDGSEALASALEDLFANPPPAEAAAPQRDSFRDADLLNAAGQMPPPKVTSRRPPYTRPLFLVVAVLWLLLLAGAAFLFGPAGSGKWTLGKALSPPGWAPSENAAARTAYRVRDVTWFTDNAFDGGTLFAVTGTVTNVGPAARDGIRIRATLMGKDNQALSEKEVYAGNRLDNTTLRHTKRDVVDAFLTRPPKDGAVNRQIPSGETLSFIVVFFDPPQKIESVLVRPIPAEGK